MHPFRRGLAPMYLAGAAAVLTVVSIAAFEILMGAALVALIVTRARWHIPRIWLPFAVFVAGTLVSLAASGHMRQGLPQVKKFYVYLMVILVTGAFHTVRQIRWVAFGWTLAASLSAAWALNQFYNKYEDAQDAHTDFYHAYVADRITGFMSHWMTFSGQMMIALLVIGALVFFGRESRLMVTYVLIGAGALITLALVAAETRSVWLATAIGGAYLIWFWKRWALLAIPVVVAVVVLVNPFEIGDRVVSAVSPHGNLDSNAHRAMCRAIGWEMIKAHPLLGVGPEQVGPQHLQYLPPGATLPLPSGYYGHLHNMYIHYAAERGVPTMLALLWMLWWALADFARALRRSSSEQRWVLHAAIAVMLAVLIGGYEELNLGDSEVLAMFLAVVGCGYVAVYEVNQECQGL